MQKPTYKHNKRIRKRAFTLVELLIVIAIIGILFVVLIGRVDFASNKAKTSGVQTDLHSFANAAHMSAIDNQEFISDKSKLADSLNSYLDEELKVNYTTDIFVDAKDPWGNNYEFMQFKLIGTRGEVVFFSKGPDGIAFNNDDEVAMITYYDTLDAEIVITYPMESPHIHVFEAYESEKACKEKGNCQSPATYYYSCRGCGMKKYDTFTSGMPDMSNHIDEVFAGTKTAHTKCSGCNTTISSEHKFVETVETAATCTSKGKSKYTCECGYSYTDTNIPIDPNNHSRDLTLVGTKEVHSQYYCCNTIVGDESAHTYTQSIYDEPNCMFKGSYKYACDCGYTYYEDNVIPTNPNNHYWACTIDNGGAADAHKAYNRCGQVVEDGTYHTYTKSISDEPNCTFKGSYKYVCDCGYTYYEYNVIPTDPNNHYWACTIDKGGTADAHKAYKRCGQVVEDGTYHTYTQSVYDEPNCTLNGSYKYACDCGYTYYEYNVIPTDPDNHYWACTIDKGGAADAHKAYNRCGQVVEDGTYHTYTQSISDEPNCTIKGSYKYSCDCGYTYYEYYVIPTDPDNHHWACTIDKGGTADAHKAYKRCGQVVEDGLYHTYTKTVSSEPNCTVKGSYKYSCDCGYTYYEDYVIPTDPNNHYWACTIDKGGTADAHKAYNRCGQVVEDGTYHTYTKTVSSEPDCIFKGSYKYSCDCGYTYYEYNVIPTDPNNHYVFCKIENGGTADAHKVYGRCGKVIEDGSYHTYTKTVYQTANCMVTGSYKYSCDCGYTYYEYNVIPKDPNNHYSVEISYTEIDANTHLKTTYCKWCDTTITETESHNIVDNACTECVYKKED